MANSLKDTPSAWVRLDKEAKEPISRDKLQLQQGDDKKEYRASPPLARPLYRPAPPTPDRSAQNDFSDLPDSASGEEQIMLPTRKQPPAMGSTPQNPPPQRDRIENLINEIQ